MASEPIHVPGSPEPIEGRCGRKLSWKGPGAPRFCKRYPIAGGKSCPTHGSGNAVSKQAAARAVVRDRALAEARRLGGSLDVDPHEVLLDAVREAAANVEVLRVEVAGLGVAVAPDGAIAVPEQRIEWDKGGTHVPARVHILVALYSEERDRLVKYAKLAIEAGVAERQVRVAEQQAQRLGQAFSRALDVAAEHLTPASREAVRLALAAELRRLPA